MQGDRPGRVLKADLFSLLFFQQGMSHAGAAISTTSRSSHRQLLSPRAIGFPLGYSFQRSMKS